LYIDGILITTATATNGGAIISGDSGIFISSSGTPWTGQLDIPMIYNRAFTNSGISLLYREPFCMFEREPIELWAAAACSGAPPAGNAGIMTTNTGYWGPTF